MYLWFIAAAVAYFIKGLCGFANTLVLTSILSFGTPNSNISPVDLLLGYPSNLILTWENRKRLNPKIYLPLAGLVLAGSLPGAFLLKNVDARAIKLVFGIVVIVLGVEMLLRDSRKSGARSSKVLLVMIGILSGMLCGMFGVGALLAAYVGRVTDDTEAFKANINAVFIVDNTFRIILYSVLHLITADTIKMSLLLFPIALLGLAAGVKCSHIMNEKVVRKLTVVLLIISGVSLILKNI